MLRLDSNSANSSNVLVTRVHKIDIVMIAIILAIGIFLRITPHAFSPGATLHFLAPLHPQPAWTKIGFDEGLYREYVNALRNHLLVSAHWTQPIHRLSFFDLEPAQNVVVTLLKLIIVAAAVWLAWKNRQARGRAFMESIAYIWLVFFVFAPGACPQYLIWFAPLILILSPTLYSCVLVASSIFSFEFYNITSGGLPWSVALAMDDSKQHWTAWALLPWTVIVAGSLALWRKSLTGKINLGLLSLEKFWTEPAHPIS